LADPVSSFSIQCFVLYELTYVLCTLYCMGPHLRVQPEVPSPHLLFKRGVEPRVKPGVWHPEIRLRFSLVSYEEIFED
jgi:hypothetical protein